MITEPTSGDFATIPIVDDEAEFAATITEMVARGNIEPKLRFVRRRGRPGGPFDE